MAREQQRHHLVADLPLGHAGALLVARQEQHREQVAPILARRALADDAVDDVVEAAGRLREPTVAGCREPRRDEEAEAREAKVVEVLDRGTQAGDLLDAGRDVGVEEGPRDDPERQRRHLVVQVDGSAPSVHESTLSWA